MKKLIKYLVGLAILFLIAYNSVYFKKLDEVKAAASKDFDAKKYARNYWDKKLLPSLINSLDIHQLLSLLKTDKENTFRKYSHSLGMGNVSYFLVKGSGSITGLNENDIDVESKTDSSGYTLKIATEFVYGNAIRDASGLVDLNEFDKTMDFNNVSAEISKIVRNEVLPPFKTSAKTGDMVDFTGAIELNKEHLDIGSIEVIPIQLTIKK